LYFFQSSAGLGVLIQDDLTATFYPKPCVSNTTSICLDNKIANAYIKHLKGEMVIYKEGIKGIEL
jgi:hypothetical protein